MRTVTDAHLHLVDLENREGLFWERRLPCEWKGAVVAHDIEEYRRSQSLRGKVGPTISGFGIHPQNPVWDSADFLTALASTAQIDFIGEAGFDFFGDTASRDRTPENIDAQAEVFEFQAGLAKKYSLPLLLHARKSMDIVMRYGRQLKSLPSVIFHSWPGRLEEAESLLKKGINSYFSIGTPILRGAKHSIESCLGLPPDRLLAETDAPWQPPHGMAYTGLSTILDVIQAMAAVRKTEIDDFDALLVSNFRAAFFTEI